MAAPMRVGILNDISDDPSFMGAGRWVELVADDLQRTGRLDRGVELVGAFGAGLPEGTAAAVERAYVELLDRDRIGFPAVHAEADYHAPLRFGDVATIALSVVKLGESSITMQPAEPSIDPLATKPS